MTQAEKEAKIAEFARELGMEVVSYSKHHGIDVGPWPHEDEELNPDLSESEIAQLRAQIAPLSEQIHELDQKRYLLKEKLSPYDHRFSVWMKYFKLRVLMKRAGLLSRGAL